MFPRLCVRRCLQQHLRLCPDTQQWTKPAVLRVCRQWGKAWLCLLQSFTGADVWVLQWRQMCSSASVPLVVSPVICRGVQPDVWPPPAGEHLEEGGSYRPAGDEPAAHKAPVLCGRQLPWHQVTKRLSRVCVLCRNLPNTGCITGWGQVICSKYDSNWGKAQSNQIQV